MSDSTFKFDKTLVTFGSYAELKAEERAFWLSKSPLERLAALELLRQTFYGYDPATARVQRILSVVELDDLENLP